MKSLRIPLLSLALLAGCSVQTSTATTSIDGAAVATPAGGDSCCDDAAGAGSCCSSLPGKAEAMAAKPAAKTDECGTGCCGACAPEAEAKQP